MDGNFYLLKIWREREREREREHMSPLTSKVDVIAW